MVQQRYDNLQSGYVALLTVLIVSAIVVMTTTSVLLASVSGTQMSITYDRSAKARYMADTCAETALLQVKNSPSFSGTDTVAVDSTTCTYTVTNTGGQSRTITATGTVNNTTRKVKILLTNIRPVITIASWQEVSDF